MHDHADFLFPDQVNYQMLSVGPQKTSSHHLQVLNGDLTELWAGKGMIMNHVVPICDLNLLSSTESTLEG